jgi:hypothetical protein
MSAHISPVCTALVDSGIPFCGGGQWLRLRGEHDAVSINAASGGWRDHRTGAHGSFRALGDYLGVPLGGAVVELDRRGAKSGATDSAKSIQLARTRWARAIPALPPKRPHGWAQAAWDREQSRYQEHRDTLYAYLASRGLDPLPLLPLIRIQTVLGGKGIDREMLDQGADFCFFLPMYRLGAAEAPENICGIQRTYLAHGVDRYTPVRKVGSYARKWCTGNYS